MTRQKKNSNFKIFRVTKGLTQKDLAMLVGVTDRSIQLYESGKRFPTVDVAKKIADELGKPIEEIFFTSNTN
ncbi:helix-turn-helix transcriptional regulator [Clostridium thermarum]|uniref:helix-turn-helix transcriptional regulator n=1 Tax=Clostridium thermarum TaxID=1716543 RepID=UPI001123953B|nr:helix-turn-helix transcriptional regulator [Clostridium thermarum]